MTANDGARTGDNERSTSATPTEREASADKARDPAGRFAEGNRFSRGRPRSSFSREARRQADMTGLVRRLIDLIECDRTNPREVLQAMQLLISYTEGKPVSRSISMTANASQLLPAGFAEMAHDARERVLDDLRARALSGDAFLLDDGGDDAQD